jgi:hypothetical protein
MNEEKHHFQMLRSGLLKRSFYFCLIHLRVLQSIQCHDDILKVHPPIRDIIALQQYKVRVFQIFYSML